jgi:hypothetical protein
MKQLRGQGRQFIKQATERGWYVQSDNENRTLYWTALERDWVGTDINGAWWTRSWMESREAEDGGAPERPYTHTHGQELTMHRGPFSLTNTLRFKFNYIGFFELIPDPVEAQDQLRESPIAIDVRTDGDLTIGTTVVFKVRPKLRFGLPKSNGIQDVIRGASIQVSFELIHWGHPVLKGDVQAQWRGRDDASVTFDLALVMW